MSEIIIAQAFASTTKRIIIDFIQRGIREKTSRPLLYNHYMTFRKVRENQQAFPKKIQDIPSNNLYLRPTQPEIPTVTSLKDFRSLSKGKQKLKLQMFEKKSLPTNQTPSKHPIEPLKSYSSFTSLSSLNFKPNTAVRDYLAQKNALLAVKKAPELRQIVQQPKKERRQFKLIHQIKKDKAIEAEERRKKAAQKQQQNQKPADRIEAGTRSKLDAFAEEIDMILESPKKGSRIESTGPKISPETVKSQDIQIPLSTKLQLVKQNHFQNSHVDVYLPPQLMQTYQTPLPKAYLPSVHIQQQTHLQPDLNRSVFKAEQMLKKRRDSASSIDASFRESKVRAQISISLGLQSNHQSRIDLSAFYKELQVSYAKKGGAGTISCRDKVNAHLEILQSMSYFVYESVKFDQIGQQWEQLNFLIYKKFYIQRRKVLNFIQKYPMRNPFCIVNAEITSKQIISFMKTEEGVVMLADLKRQTMQIKQKLAAIYNKFDKAKVGEKINLYEYDNFSHWIIEELWTELILTEHNVSHREDQIKIRICRILQLIFLISQVNGRFEFTFQEAETAIQEQDYKTYIREGKDIFEKYLRYQPGDQSEHIE